MLQFRFLSPVEKWANLVLLVPIFLQRGSQLQVSDGCSHQRTKASPTPILWLKHSSRPGSQALSLLALLSVCPELHGMACPPK